MISCIVIYHKNLDKKENQTTIINSSRENKTYLSMLYKRGFLWKKVNLWVYLHTSYIPQNFL